MSYWDVILKRTYSSQRQVDESVLLNVLELQSEPAGQSQLSAHYTIRLFVVISSPRPISGCQLSCLSVRRALK
jgi:hypothetical protein